MKKYVLVAICALSLLSASCQLFPERVGGVLKTSNGGIDWQATNNLKDNQGSIVGLSISKLAFDPKGTDVIYASSYNAGLYKSTDGAATWEQILGQIPVIDFIINPNDSQTIFSAGYFEERGRALLTRDGGKSWNAIYTAATNNSAVRAIALNPNNPQQVIIGMSQGEIIISGDSGATWRLAQNYNDRINKIIWNNNGIYILVKGTGMYRSLDNGTTFQLITANLQSAGNISNLSIFGNTITSYNQLAISEKNPSLIYLTTNLGLYRSFDGGLSWGFVSMPLRQSDLAPSSVAIAPSGDNIVYVGAGSNIYKTVDGGNTWSTSDTLTGSLVNALLIDPELPQAAYAGIFAK
jgi:photosystem II stability/assembly factor-like uncharacterized protein